MRAQLGDVGKRSDILGLVMLGAALGIYHLFLGVSSLAVFRDGVPLASRIAIIAGPFSTLPCVIVGIFSRKTGAALLIAGGIVSFVALSLTAGMSSDIVPFFFLVTIPMVTIGGGFLILKKERESERQKKERSHDDV